VLLLLLLLVCLPALLLLVLQENIRQRTLQARMEKLRVSMHNAA
jgi:hypothetical protein